MSVTDSAAVYRGRRPVRAGILVTGTEILTGQIADRNGPWLSAQLTKLGVEVSTIAVVADRPDDVRRALSEMAADGVALIVTSGGLGPTADDLTAAAVGEFCRRPMVLRPELEREIFVILARSRGVPDADPDQALKLLSEAQRLGAAKQATLPEGACALPPQGTAPGFVSQAPQGRSMASSSPTIVVLPGPPRELRGMWPAAVACEQFRAAIAAATPIEERMLRLFEVSEAEIAQTLDAAQAAGIAIDRLEITTCLRGGELEVSTRVEAATGAVYDELERFIVDRHGAAVFSRDETTIDDQVAGLLRQGRTIAVAESCTGGLLGGRLTERAGASAYVLGGGIVYSNQAKQDLASVGAALIERCGAVSPEVALALAVGIMARFGASVGVGVTGIAGPDGATATKPVGTVCLAVVDGDGAQNVRTVHLPGPRADVRARTTTVAMHMIRELLSAGN